MSYTSTVAPVKAALVDLLTTALATSGPGGVAVPVYYGWSPGTTADLAVFTTRPVIEAEDRISTEVSYRLPVFQPGAQPFEETYRIDLTMWAFRPDLSSDELETAETQIGVLVGAVLEALADNPSLGVVQWALPDDNGEHRVQAYEKGWAVYRTIPIEITARLQP